MKGGSLTLQIDDFNGGNYNDAANIHTVYQDRGAGEDEGRNEDWWNAYITIIFTSVFKSLLAIKSVPNDLFIIYFECSSRRETFTMKKTVAPPPTFTTDEFYGGNYAINQQSSVDYGGSGDEIESEW